MCSYCRGGQLSMLPALAGSHLLAWFLAILNPRPLFTSPRRLSCISRSPCVRCPKPRSSWAGWVRAQQQPRAKQSRGWRTSSRIGSRARAMAGCPRDVGPCCAWGPRPDCTAPAPPKAASVIVPWIDGRNVPNLGTGIAGGSPSYSAYLANAASQLAAVQPGV